MANLIRKVADILSNIKSGSTQELCDPVNFKFHDPLSVEDPIVNGLLLNSVYLPQEIIEMILLHLDPIDILHYSLVCKLWCNIIKSDSFWHELYKKYCKLQCPKQISWYVYYCYFTTDNFKNLIKNGNGENKFENWVVVADGGDRLRVEETPQGSDPLPQGVEEFYGSQKCFATSYHLSKKIQEIDLRPKRLLRYILLKYKPKIYASEYMAGRFDCGCKYGLRIYGFCSTSTKTQGNINCMEPLFTEEKTVIIEQWQGRQWKKVEIEIDDYNPENLITLVFDHEGSDTQFWKGHYGSKFAGGVLKFDINSIETRI